MTADDSLALRRSESLAHVPPERDPAPAALPSTVAATAEAPDPHDATPPPSRPAPGTALTWALGGLAALAALGWITERRRRRLLEMEKDSVLWADVQPPGASIITTMHGLDEILPDSPDPEVSARAVLPQALADTSSRREATLIDLHELHGKLWRRRGRGDNAAAVLLLQQHLVDFRYTSPWVFLELRELYQLLDRQAEWDTACEAFGQRFGQEAPMWEAPSTAECQLVENPLLHEQLSLHWPRREARLFILRALLGEPELRQKGTGPALLRLGEYRDLMLLDKVLDEIVSLRPTTVTGSLF